MKITIRPGTICLMVLCISGNLLPALAQQTTQPGTSVSASSQQPVRRGPTTLRNGPPLGITDTVGPLHIRGFSRVEALQQISRKANVMIGVETILYKTDKTITFDFPGGTVADLLNAFVSQAPDFQWQNDSGIIHVFRGGAHVPLADLVLNYPGASEKTRFDIWRDLHILPEYRAWLQSSRCHPAERPMPIFFHFDRGPIDIPAGQMTVSQLLDQVAIKTGDGFWAVVQSDSSTPVCWVAVVDWSL